MNDDKEVETITDKAKELVDINNELVELIKNNESRLRKLEIEIEKEIELLKNTPSVWEILDKNKKNLKRKRKNKK